MIKFHKVNGKPAKVPAGEEDIWYSYPNGIYVVDNDGNPRLISPGRQIGSTTPVGVPPEPGIFYYNTSNRKNYISTDEKWEEIGTKAIPGSNNDGNAAGNIMITDSGNYYTSIDVEGVLAEIAEKFPWYFGTLKLKDYSAAASALKDSNEKYATNKATGFPSTGWLTQRKASNNNTYGFLVAENGAMYTRVGDKFTQLATAADLASSSSNITDTLGEVIDKLKISAGDGITVDGATIKAGQTVRLSDAFLEKIANMEKSIKEIPQGNFVKITGDTMTGNLSIRPESAGAEITLAGREKAVGSLWADNNGDRFGLWSYMHNQGILTYEHKKQLLRLQSPKDIDVVATTGRLEMVSKQSANLWGQSDGDTMRFYNAWNGYVAIGGDRVQNYISSPNGRNLTFGAGNLTKINKVEIRAGFTYATGSLVSQSSVHVGMDANTQYGTPDANLRINSFLVLYPYEVNGEGGNTRNYARIGYSQRLGRVRVQSFRKNTGAANYVDRTNHVVLEAGGFANTSSEKFKKDIKPFEEDALSVIEKAQPYLYKYKDDHNAQERLGLIIERGVPELAVERGGDSVDSYALITYLWKAVQELNKKIKNLG